MEQAPNEPAGLPYDQPSPERAHGGREVREAVQTGLELLNEDGLVSLKVQYIDRTKIESANRRTFVWRGSVEYAAYARERLLELSGVSLAPILYA